MPGGVRLKIIVPTILHVLYIESDALSIARYGFPRQTPKSIWVEVEDDDQLDAIEHRLADLHRRGCIKLYFVEACKDGSESNLEEMQDELDRLDIMPA
jgi:hypothetical protein